MGWFMLVVLVTLDVKDFELFDAFESRAVQIMRDHGGNLVKAFETERNEEGSGQEVHLIEFPSETAFNAYRKDPKFEVLSDIREQAISATRVVLSHTLKTY